ncbi:C-terminal processing peptidase [Chlorella vulgaris]
MRQAVEALSRHAAVLALSAAVAASALIATPAEAVTQEQLLFLEAWRAVDRAYVDKKFNGQNWFKASRCPAWQLYVPASPAFHTIQLLRRNLTAHTLQTLHAKQVREDAVKRTPLGSRADTHAAIRTLLASLGDPFTRFLDPDQYSALRRSTAGAVTGVGVEVSFSPKQGGSSSLVVIAPAPGGPAERAGIRPGDEILAIDGQDTSSLSLYAAGNLLQGPDGSEVVLRVQPGGSSGAGGGTGSSTSKEYRLTREQIKFNPVDSALCSSSGQLAPGSSSSSLGYIRVATFNKQTAEKVRAALLTLREQGAERFVLDVRNNGGGLFPAGVEVGRMLLDSGDIVLIADSDGVRDIYSAERTAIDPSTPLVVLANRGTASASEVLAGALKDNGRAAVAGENTFGKGVIQTLIELSDGSAVAVTVGIAPTLPLDAGTLADIPTSGEAFCRFAASSQQAPKLF